MSRRGGLAYVLGRPHYFLPDLFSFRRDKQKNTRRQAERGAIVGEESGTVGSGEECIRVV